MDSLGLGYRVSVSFPFKAQCRCHACVTEDWEALLAMSQGMEMQKRWVGKMEREKDEYNLEKKKWI